MSFNANSLGHLTTGELAKINDPSTSVEEKSRILDPVQGTSNKLCAKAACDTLRPSALTKSLKINNTFFAKGKSEDGFAVNDMPESVNLEYVVTSDEGQPDIKFRVASLEITEGEWEEVSSDDDASPVIKDAKTKAGENAVSTDEHGPDSATAEKAAMNIKGLRDVPSTLHNTCHAHLRIREIARLNCNNPLPLDDMTRYMVANDYDFSFWQRSFKVEADTKQ